MQYPVIIFDLDGTLLDTVDDIGSAANQVLKEMGYPSHLLSAYQQFVGSGIAVLFERALPKADVHPRVVAKCIARFERAYAACWNQATTPYQKIPQLLDELLELGYHLAVLSNKPDSFAKKCVLEYFSEYQFDPIFGQRIGVARKPGPLCCSRNHEISWGVCETDAICRRLRDRYTDSTECRNLFSGRSLGLPLPGVPHRPRR